MDFTLSGGSILPTASFNYDSSTSTFTSFDVVWNSDNFDLTSAANSYAFTSPTDPCYSGSTTGAQEVFLLMTTCFADDNPTCYWEAPTWTASFNGVPSNQFVTIETRVLDNSDEVIVSTYHSGTTNMLGDASGGLASTAAVPEPGSCAFLLIGL